MQTNNSYHLLSSIEAQPPPNVYELGDESDVIVDKLAVLAYVICIFHKGYCQLTMVEIHNAGHRASLTIMMWW